MILCLIFLISVAEFFVMIAYSQDEKYLKYSKYFIISILVLSLIYLVISLIQSYSVGIFIGALLLLTELMRYKQFYKKKK